MELIGEIAPDRPLLVVALPEEAQFIGSELPILMTGVGKVNAASAVASVLARGPRPAEIINLGTAGALREGLAGTHVVGKVIQHDLDTEGLRQLIGQTFGAPLALPDPDGPTLATGDVFVSDDVTRDRLAESAALVDMEGYAVAVAAQQAGVPVRLVKHVSDDAGEGAAKTWYETVAGCARMLAQWTAQNVLVRG
jgi:adenosylhomocysteine nucleosidase